MGVPRRETRKKKEGGEQWCKFFSRSFERIFKEFWEEIFERIFFGDAGRFFWKKMLKIF